MSLGKSFSYMVAAYNFSAELLRVYGTVEEAKRTGGYQLLSNKYFLNRNSMFNLKYREVGDNPDEAEILNYYNKIRMLPEEYRKIVLNNYYIKSCREIRKICSI